MGGPLPLYGSAALHLQENRGFKGSCFPGPHNQGGKGWGTIRTLPS